MAVLALTPAQRLFFLPALHETIGACSRGKAKHQVYSASPARSISAAPLAHIESIISPRAGIVRLVYWVTAQLLELKF